MRSHLTFLAGGFLAALVGAVPATGANNPAPTDITMFPPITSMGTACTPGAGTYMLTWDGASQVKCIPIPTCQPYNIPGHPTSYPMLEMQSNGTLQCADAKCPFPQMPQWDESTNKAVCADPVLP